MLDALARHVGPGLAMWLVAASVAAQSGLAGAEHEPLPAGPAITLEEALARAMARNPALVASGYQVDAAEGRLRQTAVRPNPELEFTVGDVLGTGEYSGIRGAETTVSIAWAIERGMRRRQIDTALADVALAELDARILRLDTAAETARRFIACLAFQERLEFAAGQIRLAQEIVAAVEKRVDAGRATRAEMARARAGLVRAELVEEDYAHELQSALHLLSAQWGATGPDLGAAIGDIRTLPEPEPVESLTGRVARNPYLARYLSRERIAEAKLRVAEARNRPDWNVFAGVRRFELTDDFGLVGGVVIPIDVRDRNLGRIAETRADMGRAASEGHAARIRMETAVAVLYRALRHDMQVAVTLRDRLLPLLEQALVDTQRAYELGRGTFVELIEVQAELLGANNEYLESSIRAHEAVIEIERLTGEPILLPARS